MRRRLGSKPLFDRGSVVTDNAATQVVLMRRIQTTLSTCGFLFVVLAIPRTLYAQVDGKAFLTVCNKGRIAVEAVAVSMTSDLLTPHWEIEGTSIAPGKCEFSYQGRGLRQRVFLGFGFRNSRGEFVSGRVPSVPDFGKTYYRDIVTAAMEGATERVALQPASGRVVCVHADQTLWGTRDQTFPAAGDCAEFQVGGGAPVGSGGFYPLSLVLEFRPGASKCMTSRTPMGAASVDCYGGEHYMNVSANPATGDVTVTEGTAGGDVSTGASTPSPLSEAQRKLRDAFLAELARAYEESEKRKAAAALAEDPMARADAARRSFEERQGRIDYSAEHTRNLGRVRELSQFSAQWLANNGPLYVRGTVSRVEPSTDGRKPARLFFKESPDGAFVACLSPDWFSAADLNHFVGQRLEVRGRVTQSHCGGGVADIRVTVPVMIYDLAKGTPPDEAILPGMKAPGSSNNASSAVAAIPIATRLRVTLTSAVDLLHAKPGEMFPGVLAAQVIIPGGAIPQGSAVTLTAMPSTSRQAPSAVSFEVRSVTAGDKMWRVSTVAGTLMDGTPASGVLRPGTTLVFGVNGTDPAVAAR